MFYSQLAFNLHSCRRSWDSPRAVRDVKHPESGTRKQGLTSPQPCSTVVFTCAPADVPQDLEGMLQ